MSATGSRPPVPRFGHGSRVPGWDDAVDLTKDPATVPDPATTPVPPELRETIEAAMAKYPDRRSATIPALHAAQELHGWCSPEAIDEVASVMQLTPAYLTAVATFYDMFRPSPSRATTCTCARTSRARCSAPTSSSRRCWPPPRAIRTSTSRRSSAWARATSPRWRRSTASTSGRSTSPTPSGSSRTWTPATPCSSTSSSATAGAPIPRWPRRPAISDTPTREVTDMADTAGLGPEGDTEDRPGPTAAIEMTSDQLADHPEPETPVDTDQHPAEGEDAQ